MNTYRDLIKEAKHLGGQNYKDSVEYKQALYDAKEELTKRYERLERMVDNKSIKEGNYVVLVNTIRDDYRNNELAHTLFIQRIKSNIERRRINKMRYRPGAV